MATQREFILDGLRRILQGSRQSAAGLFENESSNHSFSKKRKASDETGLEHKPKKSRSDELTMSSKDETPQSAQSGQDNSEGPVVAKGSEIAPSGCKSRKRKASDTEIGLNNEPKKSRPETPAGIEEEVERRKKEKILLRTALERMAKPGDVTDFEQKYEEHEEHEELGEGGYGSVFAGVRVSDQQPVAIKYIAREDMDFAPMTIGNEVYNFPTEVFMMLKAVPDQSIGLTPAVSLLDWFSLDQDTVALVMERPTPSDDLFNYFVENAPLPEEQTKAIIRQVVDGLVDLHTKKVFHRDIKMENLLVQSTESGPRIRIIDFGCGCSVRPTPFQSFNGTRCFAPPEYFKTKTYYAGPTSVWQLGAMLFEILRSDENEFTTEKYMEGNITAPSGLSQECDDFLHACLTLDPERRISLDQLSHHPWFRT